MRQSKTEPRIGIKANKKSSMYYGTFMSVWQKWPNLVVVQRFGQLWDFLEQAVGVDVEASKHLYLFGIVPTD